MVCPEYLQKIGYNRSASRSLLHYRHKDNPIRLYRLSDSSLVVFRLEEVGIDNAQNLAKANLVELLVRTPFKPKEIIDWIGQARLYLYFKSEVKKLRGVGIRTIFNFKIIGSAEGQLSEVAQSTEISELRLNSVYQIIKDDPGVDRLFNAANTLGVL